MKLESDLSRLFFKVASGLTDKIASFSVMDDNSLEVKKGREVNNIHGFLELRNGKYFHLMAYTSHMLQTGCDENPSEVFLTAYIQSNIAKNGEIHSLRQDWYQNDASSIVREITKQNPDLF